MLDRVDYPALAERTGRFRRGAPHALTIGADGARVVFRRSSGPYDPDEALWVLQVATGVERRVLDGPVSSYATDHDARVAAAAVGGRLARVDLITSSPEWVDTAEPVIDPRPGPDGGHIGYVTESGCLRVVAPDGTDELLAGEPGGVSWRDPGGVRWGWADPAGVQFGRTRGWWWSPDGRQVLAARTAGSVSLHLLDLDGGWVDVHWDRETYPYLAEVRWGAGGRPLITVLRRLQQHGLVLAVDPRTGETQVHAELADARWVEPIPGTPRHLPDGRVLVGGELAQEGLDARCLFADGSLLTPPGLYVRRVVGVLPRAGGADLVVEGTDGDPAVQDVFRVRTAYGSDPAKLTPEPGWHRAAVGGDVIVLDDTVWRGDTAVHVLASYAEPRPYEPRPILQRVTDRRLPAAVLYPDGHLTGTPLPVLVDLGDGPTGQRVTLDPAAWPERQWFADAGFALVVIDPRGTPGIGPGFEKVVHRRLADVALTDLTEGLQALLGKHPDLDLRRVAARGTGLGGWLAALAVSRRPEVFRSAVVREPVLDWTTLPPAFAERYLGRRCDFDEPYDHHGVGSVPPAVTVLPAGTSLNDEIRLLMNPESS